ncbi:ATP-binding protein [Solirubrobacter soli]|uniref:ATP-binding protein n=1 Tax=Solirubrobacter soli TaxID=363832 RepID=UPI00041529A0|nr:ATP-binding protein [Solirubrobacter soli]
MSSHGRRLDHWTTSLDAVEALRLRMAEVEGAQEDPITRRLMAQVAHAKSSSFIALLDGDGHVLDVNPAALIAGGVDRSEVIGLPLWTTGWWLGADKTAIMTLRQAIESVADGRFVRFDTDVRIESAGRDIGTLDLLLRPLRGRDGQVAFIVAEGRPITDRKRVEQRLARQNAELSALTQRLARVHDYRERLLGELSHDLRAPLHVVITRSEQVLRTAASDDVRAQVTGIRLAAMDALEQINDMLEQVKADHGEVQLTLVNADMSQAVRTVAEQFAPLAEDRDIELELSLPNAVSARFDVERLSRVVSNLLANAIRHAPIGGRVRCSLAAGDGAASLEVADSGPGVPEEHRAKVFGRFRSGLDGDGRSSGAGAGLGLAIVREFVELHGGEIELGQAPEGGALFTVTLPLRPPESTSATASLAQLAAAAQRTEYVRSHLEVELMGEPVAPAVPTVVIVERVPGRAESILTGIGSAAVTCVAEDAEEALRLAVELRPDAVVVGTATGDMPATSLLRRLAADDRLVGVRRVALAGEREEDPSPESLITAGAQLVLPAGAAEELGGRLWAAATAADR